MVLANKDTHLEFKMAQILQAWHCDPCEKSVKERKVCEVKKDFDKIGYETTKSDVCKYCKSIKTGGVFYERS